MSIFKRSSADARKTTEAPAVATPPGVVPPAAAPLYSTRPPESAPHVEANGSLAENVRLAREAQQSAQERIRLAVQRQQTLPCPAPGVQRRPVQRVAPAAPRTPPRQSFDSDSCAQAGLLNLAWRWQEAGAHIRAINAYVELLTRYPDTPAAATAVTDLVALSEKLIDEGQFHTAFAIYDHLEQLA